MIITIPSLIAAGIASAVVTRGITGTAVYLTAGNADVVTGDQIKTEGGLHILELGHMEPWAITMMCATLLIDMGTCSSCCHKRGKSYVTKKEAKLRDRALGQAKELVHMGAHGADKLLEDVQTYHDMHNEIVVQKMHQITPPRTGGRYGERPCGNPQCAECPKPRHIVVGFSSSEQKATIISEKEGRGPSPDLSAASLPTAGIDEEADSSPPRSIAARTPSSPRIVETPNDPFDNATPDDLFISTHLGKWHPIKDGGREETPEDEEDINRLLKKQREQNERDMQDIPGHVERKAVNYAKLYAKERLLARQLEQRQRQAFKMLQNPGNKQKLRRPHVLMPVPMGLPFTSEQKTGTRRTRTTGAGRIFQTGGKTGGLSTWSVTTTRRRQKAITTRGRNSTRSRRDVSRGQMRPTKEKTSTSQQASAAMQRQQQQPATRLTNGNKSRQFTNNFCNY
jgi:hypothetical protein